MTTAGLLVPAPGRLNDLVNALMRQARAAAYVAQGFARLEGLDDPRVKPGLGGVERGPSLADAS